MILQKLYNPRSEPMRVAGFMSGSGSNIRKLVATGKETNLYSIVVLFSDRADSKAPAIGKDFDIPVITRDIRGFYSERKQPLRNMDVRRDFDFQTARSIETYGIDVIAYGGYMSKVSPWLCEQHLGVNVHPADLSILGADGKPVYVGDKAVKAALDAGEKYLRSTTHIVEKDVDLGRILMRSAPMEVERGDSPDDVQGCLKEVGDWVIFPKTLEYLAQGRFEKDETGKLYFCGEPIPNGVTLK